MDTKKLIIKYWNQTKLIHPSYEEVAKKTGVTRQYVHKVIKAYKKSLKPKICTHSSK